MQMLSPHEVACCARLGEFTARRNESKALMALPTNTSCVDLSSAVRRCVMIQDPLPFQDSDMEDGLVR